MLSEVEHLRKQLIYQSWYRGTKETDLILGPFARARISEMTKKELLSYQAFLNESDVDIFKWVTGKEPAPDFIDKALLDSLKSYWAQAA